MKTISFSRVLLVLLMLISKLALSQCISTFPSCEDFEAAPSWTSGGANNDWAWGTPTHPTINSAGGGSNSWCVGGLSGSFYAFSEQCWVESPCYNFSSLNYPWVSFKIFWECERKWDGMVLQSSINGGATWQNVGAFGDPTDCNTANWFNEGNITWLNSLPTAARQGWSGRIGPTVGSCGGGFGSGGWVTAKHCLVGLANQPSVTFRFLMGSGTTCNSYDGIAFDDFCVSDGIPHTPNFSITCAGAGNYNFTAINPPCPVVSSYTWNFGDPGSGASNTSNAANPTHVFSAPGIYSVNLSVSGGQCNPPASITQTVSVSNISNAVITQSINCFGGTGAASVNVVSGLAPFTYTWSPTGGNSSTATGLPAGNYSVSVKDGDNCVYVKSVTISQPPVLTAATSVTNILCFGAANGSASVAASGGTPGYTYTWSPSGGNSGIASPITSGSYTVLVKDANNCTVTANAAITQPASPLSASVTFTNPGCSASNGAISVTPSGGTTGYTYTWSPSGGNAVSASGLSAGSYTVLVKDANNCTVTANANITQPATPLTAVTSVTNILCFGAANGVASVNASGGTAGYTYTWSPSGGNSSLASSLSPGNYTVLVKDANNCTLTANASITQPATPLTAVTSATNILCFGVANGAASVNTSGGTAGYTYTWSPSGGNAALASGLSPGNYTVLIKDANNCTVTANASITQPAAPLTAVTSATNILCFGAANGAASVSASGGTAGYTYTWSPSGGNTASASGLSAGSYTILVKDANNCTVTANASITQPASPLTAVTSATNILCFGAANGVASVSASGGTAGYTYTWSPSGGNSSLASSLSPGNYTVLVKDANNCTVTANASITQPATALSAAIIFTNATCGMANGSVSVTASGGTAGYTYTWSPSGGNTALATNLTAGNYNVLVKDANNCQVSQTVTIIQPSSMTFTVTKTNVSCFGGSNGSSSIAVNGGTAPYSYTWSPAPGAGQGSPAASGLSSQIYTIAVADNLGCTSFSNVLITQPASPLTAVTSVTNILCFGAANGAVSVNASGGTAGYTYTWSPSGGNAASASGLSSGSYTVLVKDANNCTVTANASITQPASPLTAVTAASNILCFGAANGAASVTASGGTAGYTYTWSPSGGNAASASGLPAGSYTVLVKDANNCTVTANASITQPASPLTAVTSATNILCFGAANGAASVSASGGTTGYTYTWSPSGGNSSLASSLSPGNYTVLIKDANNCTVTKNASITQPATPLTAVTSATNILCFGAANGAASVNASGGTAGYIYTWSPSGGNAASASGLTAGSYTVLVKDANNCTVTANASITQPASPLTAVTSATNILCFGTANGVASVNASGGTAGYTYTWSPSGGNAASAGGLSSGSYTVLVKDANNCTATANANITQPASALTATITSKNVLCNGGSNGSATITASGGTPGYTYSWASSSITSSDNAALAAGSYNAFILDANNCSFSLTTTITQPPAITLNVNAIKLCNGQNGVLTGNVSGGMGPYSYFWNNSAGGSTIAVSTTASVIYTLSAIDANGCNSPIDTAMVNILSPLTVSVSPSKTICSGSSADLTASALGGSGTYQYTWFPGSLSGQIVSVSANNTTVYTVSVTDGCSQPAVLTTTIYVESIVTPTLVADKYSGCSPVCVNFTNTAFTSPSNIQSTLWTFGDGSTSTFFQPQHCYDKPGVYFAYNSFTTNAGCIMTIALINPIKVFQKPFADFSADKYAVEYTDPTINFYNHSTSATHYYWDFGGLGSSVSVNPAFNFIQPGKYLISLIAMNDACADTAFRLVECLPLFTFYAPNTFTPNDDNVNDIFLPKGEGWDINSYNLTIFDRWGEKIHSTNQYNAGWDGRYKGQEVKDDAYTWKVDLKDIFGKYHNYIGHVVVVK